MRLKCVVITPVGPGDELYALDAADSVSEAILAAPGAFAEIVHIQVDDQLATLGAALARNHGIELAHRAGADWIFFLDARDILCVHAFATASERLDTHDAIWGGIHELAANEADGLARPGQLLEITRVDELLANDPLNTLQIGHFVKTGIAVANPFNATLGAGAAFDYYLRLWSRYRCVKIPQPFFTNAGEACAATHAA